MNKTVGFYWFLIFLSCACNLKKVFSEDTVSINLNYKGKYTTDLKNYEIVVPQRVNKDGNFISHLVSHHHSKRSAKELEFIFYKIPIGGEDYLIELTPNRKLISPGAVVEVHKEGVREPADRYFSNKTSSKENIKNMFKNLDIRKLKNTECHFSGYVKGENISKAALSTCYGLAGFIQITKGFYTIEPVAEHDPFVGDAYPHILYKTDGLNNASVCHTMGELTASIVEQVVRKRRNSNFELSLPMYIETLIVMDNTLINHHGGSDCENYVLTVFNMAFNLFHDASLGLTMTLTIVRIIRLEVENNEMNLRVNADAEQTLRYFQTWQYEINPGDDSHPNHHDIAVLITRVNFCYSSSSCGLLGLTTIGKACDPKLSAALCEDSGLRLGYVIAHEIGHLLGADHDSNNSTCNGTDPEGFNTVMNPHVSLTAQTWSKCSQAYFKAFVGSDSGSCLLDEPEEHHFKVQDLLPGVMYDADFQCKHLFSPNARQCEMGSTCSSLNCYVPGYACILTHKSPADGTHCGENMWCRDNKCIVTGVRPNAVDGNWGEWSSWSDCSRTCGSGVASSVRSCDKPQPSHGGKNCVDLIRFISEEVNVSFVGKPCETGRPSFRDIQCGEFNDWIYPEDGKVHTWKAYYFHDENPCTLHCINEEKEVAALRPRVVDGTMCYTGIRDICVGGVCKSLPCDLHFESNAIEDACGICHGDGTACDFSEGMETFTKSSQESSKIINVPSGARNIKVEETSPTSARIVVKDKDTREIYVKGKNLGMFNVPGSQAWLGMIKKNQEALNIPGPVTKPLSIWVEMTDNVTVKWSMALPAEQQRKPDFAWDFIKWESCSAKCGPGVQKSEPSCIEEKSGLVEDSFCGDLEMPPVKVRRCELAKCKARWMVGDWKGCEPPVSMKKRNKRVVYCIKPTGEGEGVSRIVPDSECPGPKPHFEESCESRRKRENAEYNVDEGFLENDSTFKSDTSEYGFHKKYEDYLKHFAAVSVPQRNCETIPLHLVSSPHFKHYFHVLETPEDADADSGEAGEFGSANGTSADSQSQKKVSPDFYKETFSGQQVDVSHLQTGSPEGVRTLPSRAKKSVKEKEQPKGGERTTRNLHSHAKHRKIKNQVKAAHEISNRLSDKRRRRLRKRQRRIRNLKFKLFSGGESKRDFNYTSPNLTKVIENLSGDLKSRYARLISKSKSRELSSFERMRLRNYQWNAYNPKSLSSKMSRFFSHFSKSKASQNENSGFLRSGAMTDARGLDKNRFDGSGMKMLLGSREELRARNDNVEKWKEERSFFANPFDPMRTGKAVARSRTVRKMAAGNLVFKKRKKRKNRKNKTVFDNWKEPSNKAKRSSRIWRKPKPKETSLKSGKEQNGNVAGGDAKTYLNNLFRDTHVKTSGMRLPEAKYSLKKPVIKEGELVVDKDLAENQQMEIVFQDNEKEADNRNFALLPQPPRSGKRIAINGSDLFRFFHELQKRPNRAAFHGWNTTSPDEKVVINVQIIPKGECRNESQKSEGPGLETTTVPLYLKQVEVPSPRHTEFSKLKHTKASNVKPTKLPSLKLTDVPKVKAEESHLGLEDMTTTKKAETVTSQTKEPATSTLTLPSLTKEPVSSLTLAALTKEPCSIATQTKEPASSTLTLAALTKEPCSVATQTKEPARSTLALASLTKEPCSVATQTKEPSVASTFRPSKSPVKTDSSTTEADTENPSTAGPEIQQECDAYCGDPDYEIADGVLDDSKTSDNSDKQTKKKNADDDIYEDCEYDVEEMTSANEKPKKKKKTQKSKEGKKKEESFHDFDDPMERQFSRELEMQ